MGPVMETWKHLCLHRMTSCYRMLSATAPSSAHYCPRDKKTEKKTAKINACLAQCARLLEDARMQLVFAKKHTLDGSEVQTAIIEWSLRLHTMVDQVSRPISHDMNSSNHSHLSAERVTVICYRCEHEWTDVRSIEIPGVLNRTSSST